MITTTESLRHPELPGIEVFPLGGNPSKNAPQQVLVVCAPYAQIPSHSHNHDAHMFVVSGSATVIASDPNLAGKEVKTGDLVFFQKKQGHGFKAGPSGMRFISTNGGIVDMSSDNWDIKFE